MPLPYYKPPTPPEPEPEPEPKSDGVNEWRHEQLVAAGWDDLAAMMIACDRSIDLHRACELVKKCGQGQAWAILF